MAGCREDKPLGCGFAARMLLGYAHGLDLGVKRHCCRVKWRRREPGALTRAARAIALLCPYSASCSAREPGGCRGERDTSSPTP